MKFVTKSALKIALFSLVMLPAAASAQDGRLTLSFTPAVATSSGDAELALSGTADYRFSEHLAFEGDITWIDAAAGGFRDRRVVLPTRLASGGLGNMMQQVTATFGGRNRMPAFTQILPNVPINIPIDLPQFSAMVDGSTWVGTMGVRYEPTVQTARFRPYVSGGLGINHTEQRYLLEASSILPELGDAVSHNGIAFSAGGGANIHLAGVLWVNADAKYFRLSRDRNVIRFGGGATVKF